MKSDQRELFEIILIIISIITIVGFLYWHYGFERGKLNPENIPSKVIEQVLEAEKEGRIEITTVTVNSSDSNQTVDTIDYKIRLSPRDKK